MNVTDELHEYEWAEDKILELLKSATNDYNESISINDQELATAYACRSIAGSAIVIAIIKALEVVNICDCD